LSARLTNVHATCVRLARASAPFHAPADAGVLIIGRSGVGKSDLALRLIAAGAQLVSDDRTDLYVRRGQLRARAPKTIAGMIEIRGVGLIDIPYTDEARVVLVAEITTRVARMPPPAFYRPPPALLLSRQDWPRLVRIVALEASAPAKIAAAAAAFARESTREIVKAQ
jgi:serine kinase of HPr protein (carbohydrate metabolism regulator)